MESGNGKEADPICEEADNRGSGGPALPPRRGRDTKNQATGARDIVERYGKTVNDLAETFEVTRDTVRDWLDSWERDGVKGLADKPRTGKPPILTPEEQEKVVELLKNNPRSIKMVLDEIERLLKKRVSAETLRRIARRASLRWKRMRRSAKNQRDEADFREAAEDLKGFQEAHRAGDLDLYYFDEAGFSLQPSVPYGWQPEGETTEIPSQRSRQVNVLGFLSLSCRLVPFMVEGSIDTEVVIACFDSFSEKIERPTLVIVDNASSHTSNRFFECMGRWEERGLFFYYLPPHCPD
jgi:transposase